MIIVTHTVFFSLQFLNNLSHEMMQYSRNSFDFEDRFNIEIPKLGGTKESPLPYKELLYATKNSMYSIYLK